MANIYRTWIYHKKEEAKIINSDEFDSYKEKGWEDSPSCFVKTTDFGVNPKDKEKVQALGEAIEGVADRINGELNVDVMDKEQLAMFAKEHFKVDLEMNRRAGTLRKQVKKLIEG